MKKTRAILFAGIISLLSMTTISAAWSNLFTLKALGWGQYSAKSPGVYKDDDSSYAYFYVQSVDYTPVYGELVNVNGTRTVQELYPLDLQNSRIMYYKPGYGYNGSTQYARICTSNYTAYATTATFKINP